MNNLATDILAYIW